MKNISMIGVDLAKNEERVPGSRRGCCGEGFGAASVAAPADGEILGGAAGWRGGRDGGVRRRASLGTIGAEARAPGAADAGGLCEALRQAQQERRARC